MMGQESTIELIKKIIAYVNQNDEISKGILDGLEEILINIAGHYCLVEDSKGNTIFPCKRKNLEVIKEIMSSVPYDKKVYFHKDDYYGYSEIEIMHQNEKYKTVSFKNITQSISKENKLLIDNISGLWNNKGTYKQFDGYLCEVLGRKQSFACLYLDADNFKSVNDTYGHSGGNAVLKKIGSIIKSNIREDDIAGRIAGDEYLIILKNINEQEVREKIKELLKKFNGLKVDYNNNIINGIGISIGCCFIDASLYAKCSLTEASHIREEIKEAADQEMYISKKNGKNRVTYISNYDKNKKL